MVDLDEKGQTLLELLVSRLPNAAPSDPRTFMTYKEVHEFLRLPILGHYGESLKRQGLTSLADWTKAESLQAITGLIVAAENREPGQGYFNLFDKEQPDYQWWADQIRQSKEYNWSPFTIDPPRTPAPPDAGKLPERVESKTYRLLRDTMITKRIKSLHEYKCQLCGKIMELSDGRRYAEAHHIQPLGGIHSGPDVPSNILCLCPNHHVELDYGIRSLDITDLSQIAGHHVDQKFIDYHNKNIHISKI